MNQKETDKDTSLMVCKACGGSTFDNGDRPLVCHCGARVEIAPQDEPVICDVCGFNLELIGHAAQCPKRERDSEPDGPVGRSDGYTDGHDVENCADPDCEDVACIRDRLQRAGDRKREEAIDG